MIDVDELKYIPVDDFGDDEPVVQKKSVAEKVIDKTVSKEVVTKNDTLDKLITDEMKRDIANISLERDNLLDQCNSMLQAFPDELKKYKKYDFEILNEETLEKLMKSMDHAVSFQQNLDLGVRGLLMGSEMAEYVCTEYTPLDIAGLSHIVKNDTMLHKNMKLMMIRNQRIRESTPSQRMAFSLVSSCLMLHAGNTHQKEIARLKKEAENTPEEIPEEKKISKQKEADIEKLANKYAEI